VTTITTAKLREMAHTLSTTPDDLLVLASSNYGVTIDDTPADTDTEEQIMAMKITQEQFDAARMKADIGPTFARRFIDQLGITITPAPPSAEMVKLAREIGAETAKDWPAVESMCSKAALATLQHAVDVVKGAGATDTLTLRTAILTALGA